MKNLFFKAFVWLGTLSALPAMASNSPTEFVINTTTKQCAQFTQGDEYVQHVLPTGWDVIKPEVNFDERIQNTDTYVTPVGTCVVSTGRDTNEQFADCCKQIKYNYVGRSIPNLKSSETGFNTRPDIGADSSTVADGRGYTKEPNEIEMLNKIRTLVLSATAVLLVLVVYIYKRKKN